MHIQSISRIFSAFLNEVLPERCAGCGLEVAGRGFCTACFAALRFIVPPVCVRCGDPFELPTAHNMLCAPCLANPPLWQRARTVWHYEGPSRSALLGFKYADRIEFDRLFAPLLARAAACVFDDPSATLIPVPLHWTRLIWRGYNQAALLAGALHRQTGLPVDNHALVRVRRTVPQQGLDQRARLSNTKGAFALRQKNHLQGRKVILVDDIVTTGATVSACVSALLKGGVAQVDVVSMARVIRPKQVPVSMIK